MAKANRLEAIRIARIIREAGFEAYFVGGCVRDTILGLEPNDWDIATNARPEQIQAVFGPDAIPVGAKFGTVWVKPGVEVTTYRKDGQYSDGRHPDRVEYADTVVEDIRRRDFTINALLMDTSKPDMPVIDLVDGWIDLKCKLLQTVGDPRERFDEDALRLMRAVRFACRFDMTIKGETWGAMQMKADLIQRISKERVAEELHKILMHPKRVRGFMMLCEVGLLDYIMPEAMVHLEAITELLEKAPADAPYAVYLACLLWPMGLQERDRVLTRLKVSNESWEMVSTVLVLQRFFEQIPNVSNAAVYYALNKVKTHQLTAALTFYELRWKLAYDFDFGSIGMNEDVVSEFLTEHATRFGSLPLHSFGGGWLLDNFQIASGPWMKTMIDSIKEEILEGRVFNEQEAKLFMMHQLANGGFGDYRTTAEQEICPECRAKVGRGAGHKMSCDTPYKEAKNATA